MSTKREPAKPAKAKPSSAEKKSTSSNQAGVYDEKPAGQQRQGKAEVFEPGVEG